MVSVKGVEYKEIKRYGFKPFPNYVNHNFSELRILSF